MESSVVEKPVEPEQVNPFDEFPAEIRQDVRGLTHLGTLTDSVEFCGHRFVIKTLRAAEEIAASQAIQPYRNTLKEPEAYAAAQVGLALISVDGDETFCPQAGPDMEAFAKARFNYITTNWYEPTIEYLYSRWTALNGRMIAVMQEIQNLSNRSLTTSIPLPGSLTESGLSPNEISSEFPDLTDSN